MTPKTCIEKVNWVKFDLTSTLRNNPSKNVMNLLTFMSFQTCMTFLLFWKTREDILKNNGLGTIEYQSMIKKY